ncbi:MAG: aminoacetone oxidase family FAD-binding enzyme [Cytophagales bacterium]|nr:aminoacetone oxidase family FAD-binding enzyme [Cytophagales bacterium]
MKRVVVVGGGAAGFFAAINIKEKSPEHEVIILEKTKKVLQKVRVSGGGRCNVTNGRSLPGELIKFYPRGGKKLYKLIEKFGTTDMQRWLDDHGVPTHIENDLRVFPASNTSQTIIDCFLGNAQALGIQVILDTPLMSLIQADDMWMVNCPKAQYETDAVVIATGSSPQFLKKLVSLNLKVNPGVPSLFTFHISDKRIKGLQGIAFPNVSLKVAGTKLSESGPMLITHWGLSGPSILKLSSWGARELATSDYQFVLIVNYLSISYEECRTRLQELVRSSPKKKLMNHSFEQLPKRFWTHLIETLNLQDKTTGELGKQALNKLSEELTQAHFDVTGKSAFKEEFVTCGGVDLSEVDLSTLESKKHDGLFFSGEVLDIDALTGGFNFQACWSASWAISEFLEKQKKGNDT